MMQPAWLVALALLLCWATPGWAQLQSNATMRCTGQQCWVQAFETEPDGCIDTHYAVGIDKRGNLSCLPLLPGTFLDHTDTPSSYVDTNMLVQSGTGIENTTGLTWSTAFTRLSLSGADPDIRFTETTNFNRIDIETQPDRGEIYYSETTGATSELRLDPKIAFGSAASVLSLFRGVVTSGAVSLVGDTGTSSSVDERNFELFGKGGDSYIGALSGGLTVGDDTALNSGYQFAVRHPTLDAAAEIVAVGASKDAMLTWKTLNGDWDAFVDEDGSQNWELANAGTTLFEFHTNGLLVLGAASLPTVRLNPSFAGGEFFQFQHIGGGTVRLDQHAATGALIDFNPLPANGTGVGWFRFFRTTNTTGQKALIFYRGDGSATKQHELGSVDSFLAADNGDVGIGFSTNPAGRLEVDCDVAYGKACLVWDQNDTDQPFVDYQGTAGATTTNTISTHNTSGATTDHIQIDLNGTKAWIAVSTNNPSA